jgi:inner membrane transporter RhtA
MLALLPATAAVVGAVVLRQIPSPLELAGIALVALGIAIHKPPA